MIKQLRPFWSPAELAQVYDTPYDHTRWPDHIERVQYTAQILHDMDPTSVADLSCGDGEIVRQAKLNCSATLGDYKGVPLEVSRELAGGMDISGPIEETIKQISPVDVFVLSETLEHVEDPGGLLSAIRDKADRLLLSTPHGEVSNENPQHYWGWDIMGVQTLLNGAGWWPDNGPILYTPKSVAYYTFQIWRCE